MKELDGKVAQCLLEEPHFSVNTVESVCNLSLKTKFLKQKGKDATIRPFHRFSLHKISKYKN